MLASINKPHPNITMILHRIILPYNDDLILEETPLQESQS